MRGLLKHPHTAAKCRHPLPAKPGRGQDRGEVIMDRGMVIFVGSLLTLSSSWLGLVLFPFWQLNGEQPYQKDPTDDPYPVPLQGKALAGKKVYQQNGCMYCHSQQVRSEKFGNWWDENGADEDRGRHQARLGPAPQRLARLHLRQPDDARHHAHRAGPRQRRQPLLRAVAAQSHVQPARAQRLEHHAVVRVPLLEGADRRRALAKRR